MVWLRRGMRSEFVWQTKIPTHLAKMSAPMARCASFHLAGVKQRNAAG